MKDIKKYYTIPAQPEEIYLALTTENTIRLWSGDEVQMKAEIDSEFSLWDGSITGRNLGFEYGHKIVQQWYFGNQEEPSIVTIKLHPHKKGTSLELHHTNIPEEAYEDILEGWDNTYIISLIEFYS